MYLKGTIESDLKTLTELIFELIDRVSNVYAENNRFIPRK